jgi:hypothetical protein
LGRLSIGMDLLCVLLDARRHQRKIFLVKLGWG